MCRRALVLALCAMLLLGVFSGANALAAPKLTLNLKVKTFNVGETLQLQAFLGGASVEGVIWRSGNAKRASVDANGLVTALNKGAATITARLNGTIAKCKLTIKQPVVGVKFDEDKLTLVEKKSKLLSPKISPANASNKKLTWKSSNPRVVSVTQKGKLVAKHMGQCTIMATSASGERAVCLVTVVRSGFKYKIYEPIVNGKTVELLGRQDLVLLTGGRHLSFPDINRNQMRALFPEGDWLYDDMTMEYYPCRRYLPEDPRFSFIGFEAHYLRNSGRWRGTSLMDYRGLFAPVQQSPMDGSVVTSRGIMLGSTPEDVVSAYGLPHYGTSKSIGSSLTDVRSWFGLGYWIAVPDEADYAIEFEFDLNTKRLTNVHMWADYPDGNID